MSGIVDEVRTVIYRSFAAAGVPPSWPEMAQAAGAPETRVREAVQTLASRHMLVLSPDGAAIERALPFAAVPTAFRVSSRAVQWWANCVWDALAIPPLIGVSATVETSCPDCASPLKVHVDPDDGPDCPALVAHFLLPAARWYDDIRFT